MTRYDLTRSLPCGTTQKLKLGDLAMKSQNTLFKDFSANRWITTIIATVFTFSIAVDRTASATPISAANNNNEQEQDCEFLCIGIIVIASAAIGGTIGYFVGKKSADNNIRKQESKQEFRLKLFDKAVAAGVITKENAFDIIKNVGDITNDSSLEARIQTVFGKSKKGAEVLAFIKDNDKVDAINPLQTEGFSQISEKSSGGVSEVSLLATTNSDALASITATNGSEISTTPDEKSTMTFIDQNALRAFNLSSKFGVTDFKLFTEIQIPQITFDLNTDLDGEIVDKRISGSATIKFGLTISNPDDPAFTPIELSLFDTNITYLSQSGFAVTGDLSGAFPTSGPLDKTTRTISNFIFPITIDNVNPDLTYQVTGRRVVNTAVSASPVPEPSVLLLFGSALVKLLGYVWLKAYSGRLKLASTSV